MCYSCEMKLPPEESVIIEPRKGRTKSNVEETVFLFFSPTDFKIASNVLNLDESRKRRLNFAKLYDLNLNGNRFSIAGPAMGAPIAVILMERLIAMGARNIVGIGSCGSLQKDIRVGEYIIPDKAVIEEGTSQHYLLDEPIPKASERILKYLKDCCLSNNLNFTMGKVWTTDAPFRETIRKITNYQNQNVLGVEMEMSALFTVGRFRGIDVGGFLVVSDELFTLKWKSGFGGDKYFSAMKAACESLFFNPTFMV
ncbi:MAG: nucleoside phosphorylase [Desulfobacterales bacterium]|nr:nucleoside phosphorylase [Desulfobacterales bacterium]